MSTISSTSSSRSPSRSPSPPTKRLKLSLPKPPLPTILPLKKDHTLRPLHISANGTILLEHFHTLAQQAQDFLTAIAEPITRPQFIHEYQITPYSLYAAVSVGLEGKDIVRVLGTLAKTAIPKKVEDFIIDNTISYGKVKLVLKRNRYYVESASKEILERLLQEAVIKEAMIPQATDALFLTTSIKKDAPNTIAIVGEIEEGDVERTLEEEDATDEVQVHSFEVQATKVEELKRACNLIDFPMMEEYDFHNDNTIPNLDIDLRPTTVIRNYQEKSLSKMFGNGRARSGIIVLPCGAGKTLVGITAACTIKKPTLVLCTSAVSCNQWKRELLRWSNISEKQIGLFTSQDKERHQFRKGQACIVISTYTMLANTGKRSHESKQMMEYLSSTEWGFLMMDEVHVVPAQMFRRVLTTILAHAKLGLTATLVREDDKISDLNFLIGPKLYEANWLDLSKQGHIANVQCAEVWCDMTPEFYAEYLVSSSRKKRLLYVMNPNKIQATEFLINHHEKRGDKTIVFSDDVFALQLYARKLGKPFIFGPTSQEERMRVLQQFQMNPEVATIFISKVGDTSIDLPEATCLIQISSHYGSRRQEAQRLGRILRAKRRNDEGFNAFFYSLVSKDTQEMYFSTKRQQFLIDQGYAFKVITDTPSAEQKEGLSFSTRREQEELLAHVLMQSEEKLLAEQNMDDKIGATDDFGDGLNTFTKTVGSMKSLSGADRMAYLSSGPSNTLTAKEKNRNRHKLFKGLHKK